MSREGEIIGSRKTKRSEEERQRILEAKRKKYERNFYSKMHFGLDPICGNVGIDDPIAMKITLKKEEVSCESCKVKLGMEVKKVDIIRERYGTGKKPKDKISRFGSD